MNKHLLQDFPEYKNLKNTNKFTQYIFDNWTYEDFVDIIDLLLNKFNTIKEVVDKLKDFIKADISSELRYDDELTEQFINIAKEEIDMKLVAIKFISEYFSEYYGEEHLYEKYPQYYTSRE